MKNTCAVILALMLCVAASAKDNLFPVLVKGKWGYTNVAGKMVIAAQYDYAENFYEGRAVVALYNQPCVIDESNRRIIDTGLYINITRYSEGVAKVTNEKRKQSFVDVNGKKVFEVDSNLYDARPFRNGLSCVARSVELHQMKFNNDIMNLGYKFGYMNKKGQVVVECKYDDADDFNGGFARVKEGNKFGVLDSTGKVIVAPKYFNLGRFIEGKAVADAGGKYGFIDSRGVEVVEPVYRYARDFSEGLGAVSVEGKFGYVNDSGQMVIQPEYESVRPFSEGLAAVKKDGKWGFIDKKGTLRLRFVFDDASMFQEGRCPVLVKRKWGYIDATGALVIPADFDAAGTFNNGLGEVMIGQISVYVNRQGSIIPKL